MFMLKESPRNTAYFLYENSQNKAQFRGNPGCEKTNIAKNLRKIKVESHST